MRTLVSALIALLIVLAADLTPFDEPLLIVYILPIVVAAYFGGIWPGIAATLTLTLGAAFFLEEPRLSFAISNIVDLTEVAALAVTGVAVSLLCESLQRARRSAETSARRAIQSERRFAETFHASPVALALSRVSDDKIVEVNEAYAKLVGWQRAEILGRSGHELGLYPREVRLSLLRRLRRTGILRNHPQSIQAKGGVERHVLVSMDPIQLENETFTLTALIDETERKRTEAALRSTDERLHDLAAASDDAFWLSTPARDRMLYVSPGYERIFGRPSADLYVDPRAWVANIHAQDRARLATAAAERDGTGAIENEYRIVRPDGSIRWVRSKVFPICDDSGTVVRLAGSVTDITDRRALEEQLRQTQKMESLGMLAGGVAHDFNNLLAVIASCNGLLAESLPEGTPDRELVDEVDAAVARAVGLTRQLLAFSRKQVAEPVVLDLNAAVNDTRKLLRRVVGEDITLSLEPEISHVRVDPGCLVQVMMNLAVNARDAMPRGGRVELSTRNVCLPELGRAVCLTVTDTGEGMTEEVRARVFEPFFTTKERGKGTGMGLAVVLGIVDQAGGKLEVESTLGVGTTFRVYLPAVDELVSIARDAVAQSSLGVEKILLVDDDDHVRRSTARALRARGYKVVEAANGHRALEVLGQRAFDLMLTDVVMPGIDGRELAESAHSLRPGLKILYMSGYTDDEVVRRGVNNGEAAFLEKPFRVPVLAAKVRQVLDAGLTARIPLDLIQAVDA